MSLGNIFMSVLSQPSCKQIIMERENCWSSNFCPVCFLRNRQPSWWVPAIQTLFNNSVGFPAEFPVTRVSTREKFEYAALFLRLGLPSTHLSVKKTKLSVNDLQPGEIWKRWLYVLLWTENMLKTKLFKNNDVKVITWISSPSLSSNTNRKWFVTVFSNVSSLLWTENIWCVLSWNFFVVLWTGP